METLQPGDLVESIRDVVDPYSDRRINQGAVYRVTVIEVEPRANLPCPSCDTGIVASVAEVPDPLTGRWCACNFRPLYRPTAEKTAALKVAVPAPDEPKRRLPRLPVVVR